MIAIENEPTVGDLSEGVELLMDDVGYGKREAGRGEASGNFRHLLLNLKRRINQNNFSAEHYRVDYFVLDGFGFYLEEEKAVVFY